MWPVPNISIICFLAWIECFHKNSKQISSKYAKRKAFLAATVFQKIEFFPSFSNGSVGSLGCWKPSGSV